MSVDPVHMESIDCQNLAQIYGLTIPPDEIQGLQQVLLPLVKACRASFSVSLGLVDPIGTFRLQGVPDCGYGRMGEGGPLDHAANEAVRFTLD